MKRKRHPRPVRNLSGPRIRLARFRQHPPLSQFALAVRMQRHGFKLDVPMLSRIETRERGVTDLELRAFARCLKTTIAWLCGERTAKE